MAATTTTTDQVADAFEADAVSVHSCFSFLKLTHLPIGHEKTKSSDFCSQNLQAIKAAIPRECFEKNLGKSLGYMALDFGAIALLYLIDAQVSQLSVMSNVLLYALYKLLWVNLQGFFFWCLFVVGHDCGHGSFSDSQLINDVCGHLCHAFLSVPFWPWAHSHRQHHRFHNHLQKDHSHPAFPLDHPSAKGYKAFAGKWWTIPVAYVTYLFGAFDGSHFVPWSPLFTTTEQRVQCVVSTLAVVANIALLFTRAFGCSLLAFAVQYVAPVLVFHTWLYVVTYLQHHSDDTRVYSEGTWNFLLGGLETIDRTYGFFIDEVSHNITNGHVVHHLFFTAIPHYALMAATRAVRPLLKARYKLQDTRGTFVQETVRLRGGKPLVKLAQDKTYATYTDEQAL